MFPWFFEMLVQQPHLFVPWEGNVLRQAAPRWVSEPYRYTGVGAVLTGGRWNVQHLFPALYGSLDPVTLAAEANYKGRLYGWAEGDFLPQTKIGMRWKLQRVLLLNDAAVLQVFGVSEAELVQCDWAAEQKAGREALTQALARAAFEHLAEGLLVPSARQAGGLNVVYFPTHRLPGSEIETLGAATIPFVHGL